MNGRLRDAEGFTIMEVVVAVALLAISATAFLKTTATGMHLVGSSKERQTAVQLAGEWMEEARAVPYSGLALPSDTVYEAAPTPDRHVTAGAFAVPGGEVEPLVEAEGGAFEHRVSDVLNGIPMEVYRYVTWATQDGDTEAYKRVTVVVQWDGTDRVGELQEVVQSTIVSTDGVAWTSTTTTTPAGSTTTTTSSTTTTTVPPGTCEGDVTGPSLSAQILAGVGAETGYSSSSTVALSLSASDPCTPLQMAFAHPSGAYSALEPFATSGSWQLEPGDGPRSMWIKVVDAAGNQTTQSASIVVDATKPTTPATFTAAKPTHSSKSVVLTWSASTDNLALSGYRVWAKQANGSYSNLPLGTTLSCSGGSCTWTHGGLRNRDVWTYYVEAIDAAGNASVKTVERTVTI